MVSLYDVSLVSIVNLNYLCSLKNNGSKKISQLRDLNWTELTFRLRPSSFKDALSAALPA